MATPHTHRQGVVTFRGSRALLMPQHIPLSVVLSPPHLAWLDAQRQQGNLSRSAALRIALDRLMQQDQAQANGK